MKLGYALSAILVIFAVGVAFVASLTDVTSSIQKEYPSAKVVLSEGHSTDGHPVLSILKIARGRDFLPQSEWIAIKLANEAKPVSIAWLLRWQVSVLDINDCKIKDLDGLSKRPGLYAVFKRCDFSSLPPEQRLLLHQSGESAGILSYGTP